MTADGGGGSPQSAGRKAETSRPKLSDSFGKVFLVVGGFIGAVGTISGLIEGFVKPRLEALLITLAISLVGGLHLTGPTTSRLPDVVLGDGILAYMGGFMVAYAG